MMRLGSRAEHNLLTDLGRFGMGSTTASLALGRVQHVVTAARNAPFLSAAADLDAIIRAQRFVKHHAKAAEAEVALFRRAFSRWGLEIPSTGTVVRIGDCDNIGRTDLRAAVAALRKYIGRTYRYFINAERRIFVNGELAVAEDPLWRAHPQTHILFEDIIEYTHPRGSEREGEVDAIEAVLVQLPDLGGPAANSEAGFTVDNSGFYVMRNRREIVAHTRLNLYGWHSDLARFRGEVNFPASMDRELGVTFLKTAWVVNSSQSLQDKLRQVFAPYIAQARREYGRGIPVSTERVPHDESVRVISRRSPFLRKPQREIMVRASQAPGAAAPSKGEEPPRPSRTRQVPQLTRATADLVEFREKDLGPTAELYQVDLEGRKVIVTYNGQHPFYRRFMLENRENKTLIAGLDYLFYALASGELLTSDDSARRALAAMRVDASFNLRQLLETV
jgi:hypothetical protein